MEARINHIEHQLGEISDIKEAVIRLTTIQEVQTKQLDEVVSKSDTVAKVVENTLSNTNNIDGLRKDIVLLNGQMAINKEILSKEITDVHNMAEAKGQARMWRGITGVLGILAVVFSYLYLDVKEISRLSVIKEKSINKAEIQIGHILKSLDEIKVVINNHAGDK